MSKTALRVVLAKVGLDGHDRGVKVVARGLRDAGMHVIYAGLWQTPEAVARTIADEDADWLGLSLLSGAHMILVPRVLQRLREDGLEDVPIVLGGIIPDRDVPRLREMGVAAVFGPGTTLDEIATFMKSHARPRPSASALLAGALAGNRLAVSRLVGALARGEDISGAPTERSPSCRVVAITGSAGVGKSTLVGKVAERLRARNLRTAILACDPSSPVSGGALLGDRCRMTQQPDDDGLFIRSLAAASGGGVLAEHLSPILGLLGAAGFEVILLETVGAGQGDTAPSQLVDKLCLLLQPETGDELQWEKAGVLEVADIVVVHKADLPNAEQVQEQIRASLELSPRPKMAQVLRVSAKLGQGVEELVEAILGPSG